MDEFFWKTFQENYAENLEKNYLKTLRNKSYLNFKV